MEVSPTVTIKDTVMKNTNLQVNPEDIEAFCKKHAITSMSLFGSVLRADFTDASDVDILVIFHPNAHPTFMTLGNMEEELEAMLNCKVDLVPQEGLKELIRDDVLSQARNIYAA